MTKEQFIKHISELVKLKNEVDKVSGILYHSFLNESLGSPLIGINLYEDLLVKILKDCFNDESDYIGYWLYELECGKKWYKGMITDENGKDIKLKSIEDLWNVINK